MTLAPQESCYIEPEDLELLVDSSRLWHGSAMLPLPPPARKFLSTRPPESFYDSQSPNDAKEGFLAKAPSPQKPQDRFADSEELTISSPKFSQLLDSDKPVLLPCMDDNGTVADEDYLLARLGTGPFTENFGTCNTLRLEGSHGETHDRSPSAESSALPAKLIKSISTTVRLTDHGLEAVKESQYSFSDSLDRFDIVAAPVLHAWFAPRQREPAEKELTGLELATGESRGRIEAWFRCQIQFRFQEATKVLGPRTSNIDRHKRRPPRCYVKQGKRSKTKDKDSHKPYCCTSGCGTRFGNKGGWKRHQKIQYPQEEWVCYCLQKVFRDVVIPCSATYTRRDKLFQHIQSEHNFTPKPSDVDKARQPVEYVSPDRCGFCGEYCKDFDKWIDHVAEHFENKLAGGPWHIALWRDPWIDVTENAVTVGSDTGDEAIEVQGAASSPNISIIRSNVHEKRACQDLSHSWDVGGVGQDDDNDDELFSMAAGHMPQGDITQHASFKISEPSPEPSTSEIMLDGATNGGKTGSDTEKIRCPENTIPTRISPGTTSCVAQSSSLARSMDISRLIWYCCECGLGPSLWANNPCCSNCSQRACGNCHYANEAIR